VGTNQMPTAFIVYQQCDRQWCICMYINHISTKPGTDYSQVHLFAQVFTATN